MIEIIPKCSNCNARMEPFIYNRNIPRYKYCPKCGLLGNNNMKQAQFASQTQVFFAIGCMSWPSIVLAIYFEMIPFFIFLFVLFCLIKILQKTCPKCLAVCERKHKFCYNCGHKF